MTTGAVRRMMTAAALAAALALAGPAEAAGRSGTGTAGDPFTGMWRWWAGVWGEVLEVGLKSAVGQSGGDAGGGIDPDGASAARKSEKGGGIDPDGATTRGDSDKGAGVDPDGATVLGDSDRGGGIDPDG